MEAVSRVICEVYQGKLIYLESAVDKANAMGVMLGMVARKPLLKLNGRGQKRMPVKYRMPSLRNTCPRATKRGSLPTMRSTYLARKVLLATKQHKLPIVQALATIGHAQGKPYTKPAIVLAVEYPMTGGKLVINTRKKQISQPPLKARHDSEIPASHSNSRWEYTPASITST